MHVLLRGDTLQRLRLVSGLILFTFALTHFLNHSIGLFSIDLMQDVQQWRWVVTRSWLGTIILAAALVTHISLAFYKLASRSTLQLPRWEALQLILGILIPFLLFPHIVNTRFAHVLFGVNDIYLYELLKLWPVSAVTQSLLLLLVWIHGCIGIHFWLRLYAPYRRLAPLLLGLAIIIPAAALGGFMVAGRAANAIATDPRILTSIKSMTHWPSDAHADQLAGMRTLIRFEYAALLAIIATYFIWTRLERRFGPRVTITYVGGPTIKTPRGPTLLEISRIAQGAARRDLRRTRALFDVPRAHRARFGLAATAGISRECHPRQHQGSSERAPRLPDSPRRKSRRHAPSSRGHGGSRGRRPAARRLGGHRAAARGHVRRSARLHPPLREAPTLRRRLHSERVLRRRRWRDRRPGRTHRQVPRRWSSCSVR